MQYEKVFSEELIEKAEKPIAVVGNADLPHEHGEVIDAHPTVIRFNHFYVRGFEKRVGSKTTIHCVNIWPWMKTFPEFPALCPHGVADFNGMKADMQKNFMDKGYHFARTHCDQVAHGKYGVRGATIGFLLAVMFEENGFEGDFYFFDGLMSGHYWDPKWDHGKKHKHAMGSQENIAMRDMKHVHLIMGSRQQSAD
jgi:hypothetical protein